jgi:16S rRNA (uracil1498-N3)-methyltransferase
MTMRFFVPTPLVAHSSLALPDSVARHAQVRRVQPGDTLTLFDGHGSDWPATVQRMGKHEVQVQVGAPVAVDRELAVHVTLALGMPANERMDTLVEKATELGVAHIQPLMTERSVLRLNGERAQRKQEHWQAIAQAACEQCGRARVPLIGQPQSLASWLAGLATTTAQTTQTRWLLSLQAQARALRTVQTAEAGQAVLALSGPEGGLSEAENQAAQAAGFVPVDLGPRVLRADTAPLAVLAWLGLQA